LEFSTEHLGIHFARRPPPPVADPPPPHRLRAAPTALTLRRP
jgi:hypothetical protein